MVSVALQMSDAPMTRQHGHDVLSGVAQPAPMAGLAEIILRVSGGKPLRFAGPMVAEATSCSPAGPAWHEVALYRTQGPEWVVCVRMLKKAMGETDIHHARLFGAFDDALAWLEQFDPTADLAPGFDASDRRVSTAEIALLAAALRQHADAVARQWRGLLGELLYRCAQLGCA